MFKNTWHTKVYLAIIDRASKRKSEGYVERHHIVPKCMGGSNATINIVSLTAREHFICHLLLIRMAPTEYRAKLVYAAWQQSRPSKNKTVKVTNRVYAYLREQMYISYTGQKRVPFSDEARKNISEGHKGEKNHMFGKTRTADEKAKMSANRKGICTGADNPFYGKQHTDEFKLRKAEHNRNRPKVLCLHCNKLFDVGMANRWHLDKCKSRP
jgi:hypothetical protein